ncbi:MAG: type IX secretion system outer membrane channel protein PorV [Candidatus Cyclobacteriaceae bacterium M2_1C_046]
MKVLKVGFLVLMGIAVIMDANAQVSNPSTLLGADSTKNPITTAVPFMLITPDARAGAMGDVGVATSPDANSSHWNPAKLTFVEKDYGFALSYSPWLSKIIPDMSLSYLTGFYKISREQTVGVSLRYFDLGEIIFRETPDANSATPFNPRELAAAATYSRMLTEQLSLGVTAKYIHSNLTGSFISGTTESQPGNSVAADIGVFYNSDLMLSGRNSHVAFGAAISNIGSKLTYASDDDKDFIPTNLRIGTAFTTFLDPYNKITFALDFNKLMVPTPPIYDQQGNIIAGEDPDKPLLSGMFGSFSDAPNGFSEEIKEVTVGGGAEYWYNETFAARLGYFYEHEDKGNRKYLTVGLGFRYQKFGIDFAYLVPQEQEHPLAETLRFSLLFSFDKNTQEEETVTE